MILSRNSFFIVLGIFFLLPLPLIKGLWLLGSKKAMGTMYFTGHGNLGSVLGTSTYPVIRFKPGKDVIYFNGNVNIPFRDGEEVQIRFHPGNPSDAKIDQFSSIWGDTLAYETGPFLILLVIFFHPDLVPGSAKVCLGRRPIIRIIESD